MCQDDLDKLMTGGLDAVLKAGCFSVGLIVGIALIWTILILIIR